MEFSFVWDLGFGFPSPIVLTTTLTPRYVDPAPTRNQSGAGGSCMCRRRFFTRGGRVIGFSWVFTAQQESPEKIGYQGPCHHTGWIQIPQLHAIYPHHVFPCFFFSDFDPPPLRLFYGAQWSSSGTRCITLSLVSPFASITGLESVSAVGGLPYFFCTCTGPSIGPG